MSQILDQEVVIILEKKCVACEATKPLNEFRRYDKEKYRPKCKECEKNSHTAQARELENDIMKKVEKDWYAMWIG